MPALYIPRGLSRELQGLFYRETGTLSPGLFVIVARLEVAPGITTNKSGLIGVLTLKIAIYAKKARS